MALLNRKVDYALLILCYLHHHRTGGCAREIAAQFGLSRAFVANILKDLCQKGFVLSHRGVKGGYLLQDETIHLTMAGLMDALDEHVRLAECNDADPTSCCSLAAQCPIRAPIAEVHQRLRGVLEQVTLADLFRAASPNPPVRLEVSRCESVHESR
jgi:Rrf2 family transcriptional regulator, cysteine metabolism repressor